jgi:hypothetical protein
MYNKAVLLQSLQHLCRIEVLNMLDTVKVFIPEYDIASDSSLEVQPARFNAGTGEVLNEFPLFRTVSGKQFQGSRAFLNTPLFNLDIKPFSFSSSGVACFLHFSVPKVHYGDNYYSVGEQGTHAVFNQVEKELREAGFYCNLQNAHYSRIDTFRNIEPSEPFETYSALFSLLNASRRVKRDYGNTFLVSNTQQEFIVYDKLAEMELHKKDISEFPETMRFEHRLLNKQKIESILGFSQVADTFKGGYAVIRDIQKQSWRDNLFKYSVEEVVQLGSQELAQEMQYFQNKHGSRWFGYFLRSYGAFHLAQFAGVEVVEQALEYMEAERTKVWRARKMLEEAERELLFSRKEPASKKTYATLYEELKDKVLA